MPPKTASCTLQGRGTSQTGQQVQLHPRSVAAMAVGCWRGRCTGCLPPQRRCQLLPRCLLHVQYDVLSRHQASTRVFCMISRKDCDQGCKHLEVLPLGCLQQHRSFHEVPRQAACQLAATATSTCRSRACTMPIWAALLGHLPAATAEQHR